MRMVLSFKLINAIKLQIELLMNAIKLKIKSHHAIILKYY